MRILYDGKIFSLQLSGGINRYFSEIISRLPQNAHPTLIGNRRKNNFPSHPNLRVKGISSFPPHKITGEFIKKYYRYIGNNLGDFDLVHPTYFSSIVEKPLSSYTCPVVLTVYDMIHELFKADSSNHSLPIHDKKEALYAADRIICISESTRLDLLRFYPEVEKKVTVIGLAASLKYEQSFGSERVPEQPYFLYVGSRQKEYKNFDVLLSAFSKLAYDNSEILLCVVGAPLNVEESKLVNELNLAERIRLYSHVDDNHLAKLYRCSIAFIYPSRYEGFGIPPLEAMACGTPVVASNTSSIPEVVSDAGILFNPEAVGELVDILSTLLNSPSKRDEMIQKGKLNCQRFTWDKTASQTFDVYSSLI